MSRLVPSSLMGVSPMQNAECRMQNENRVVFDSAFCILHSALVLMGWLLAALSPLAAQTIDAEPPTRHVPLKPVTRQELDHLEAVKLYARGVLLEHQNRLIEATRTFEEALPARSGLGCHPPHTHHAVLRP